MSLENLCTSQLFSHFRAICISRAVGFQAICTSPRPNKTAVALTLLVLGTIGSVERHNHKSSANRNNLIPRQSQSISLCTCWCSSDAGKGSLSLAFWFTTNSHPFPMDSDGVGRAERSCRLGDKIQIPTIICVPGCCLATCPPSVVMRIQCQVWSINGSGESWSRLL